jgi:rhodanese-related sulfurtransferase
MASPPVTVTAAELKDLLESGTPPRPLDVRAAGEFETVHIPGAYNVPLDLLNEHRREIATCLNEDVVFVCRSGQRATQADASLRGVGLANVRVLDGGITDWEKTGFPVKRGAQRWALERQVRLVAGSIVLSSVIVSSAVPRLKWLAAVTGGGLTVAALTNTCAMGMALARLPYNRGPSCDPQTLLAQLKGSTSS